MSKELSVLTKVVHKAGQAVAKMRKQGVEISLKDNSDILTQADLHANQVIKDGLMAAFPDDGWLSEESVDDPSRMTCQRLWVVDPIDGTKEYANGINEYAVSVALVEKGKAIVGCIYNPETDELFAAEKGKGATLNGKKITCKRQPNDKLVLLASRSEYERGEWDQFADEDVKVVGSIAYKLGLVAAGMADATFSLGPKSEWDIAAGVIIVKEAGGVVTDKAHQEFTFNQADVRVNGIVAASKTSLKRLQSVLAEG